MMSPIGFRVRELREARGWTQTELAKRAGIRRATVNRLENQRVTSIDLTVLEKLAKALDVDPAYLLVKEGRTRKKNR
jgi:transcriptional regulator with XRE-family HTH domain